MKRSLLAEGFLTEKWFQLRFKSRKETVSRSALKRHELTLALLTVCPLTSSPQWELQEQKLESHLMRTQSLKVLPFKPGVGQHIAMHATLTARDFFLANFYPSGPFTCIFPKSLPSFSCVSCGKYWFLCRPTE